MSDFKKNPQPHCTRDPRIFRSEAPPQCWRWISAPTSKDCHSHFSTSQLVTLEWVVRTVKKITPSQSKEPINLTLLPDWPFQQIIMGLFHVGNHACTERLTGWLILYHLSHDKLMTQGLLRFAETYFKPTAPLKNSAVMVTHTSHPFHSNSFYKTGLLNASYNLSLTHNPMVKQSSLSNQPRES